MNRFAGFKWAVATTLARWSPYRSYKAAKGLLALSVVGLAAWFAYHQGKTTGQIEGVDFMLQMCYANGGFVMNEAGQTIVCGPLTQVPQEELDKFSKKV